MFYSKYKTSRKTVLYITYVGISSGKIVSTRPQCTTCQCMHMDDGNPTIFNYCSLSYYKTTRIWANAKRDGRPAKYRWRPLFNAAKFGWRPLLECRAVTLPRRKSRWNLQGCHKLANISQPLARQSSLYYEDTWRRYRCLTNFFPIVDTYLSCEDTARQSCLMVPKWRFFASCIFSEQTCILNSH